MSLSPQIKILNKNLNLYKINQETLSQRNNLQIPRWLLEFNQQINTFPSIKNSRPSTEENLSLHPKWFEELSQKRRMSDICNVNLDDKETMFLNNNHKINYEIKPMKEFNRISSDKKSNSLTDKSNEMESLETDPFMSSLIKQENKSQKIDNKSVNNKISSYDDHLFSNLKSIENLKLDEIEDCIIPEMPTGKKLDFILLENWGDQNFIGLNGIEILDHLGNRPQIKNIFLENDCLNSLEMNDLSKLIDNVYRTHDDAHIWQCRFDDKPIHIIFQFDKPTTIALIRIWNHNKSRIHSYRGVKFVKVKLDEQTIFCGEIAKANGDLNGSLENFGDTILYTTNEEVLDLISHFDISFQELLMEQMNDKI